YPFGLISDESVDIFREMGFKALLSCYEKPNYISRSDPDCLLCINRYNRPSGISTEEYMKKLLKQ
ncbi:MAG: polysaccharide deacetylase family protein, partial [Oscillospiraceae bacterium]